MLCACLPGLLGSSPILLAAAPPSRNDSGITEFAFDIPASSLDEALARFTEQSGYSVGISGALPRRGVAPLSGRFTAQRALQQLLAGSGIVAVPLGAEAFRLEVRSATPDPSSDAGLRGPVPDLGEVVVTASKRRQEFRTLPLSMTVVSGVDIGSGLLPGGSSAAHLQDAATSTTNLGPGRERQFIRGVADSPFLGPSQATVSVQFDDARANYDGPDPDLLLIDVEQVEILKGPQGPLYGTGALGGVFHIVPRRPDLQTASWQSTLQLQQLQSGGRGIGADLVANLPLAQGRAGLRAVMYATTEPGWIDNTGGRHDANDTRIRGGRVALRSRLPAEWTLDLQGVAQYSQTADSQYVVGDRDLGRSGVLSEPHDNDFLLGVVTAQGRILGLNALVTKSVVSHESDGLLDASAAAVELDASAPLRYRDQRRYHLLNEEVRLWSDPGLRFPWLVGASYMAARNDLVGRLEPLDAASREVVRLSQRAGEASLFGEVSAPIGPALRATLGLRAFRSQVRNRVRVERDEEEEDENEATHSVTPSLAIDWRDPEHRRFIYLRYARAVRPGGLDLGDTETHRFAADKLSNVDLGARLLAWGEALELDSTLFATRWSDMQSDYLLDNGLVGTRNVGSGRIVGVEGSVRLSLDEKWRIEGALTLQRARLHDSDVVSSEEDRRLPVVPDLRMRASVIRSRSFGPWRLQLRADTFFVGSSRLSFEPALDRRMGDYVRADLGARLQRGPFSWSLRLSNLLDSRADTFAFGNPFSIRTQAQYTPLKPRTLTLGMAYSPAR